MSFPRIGVLLAVAFATWAASPSPAPSPSASAGPVPNARSHSRPERLAIATCSRTYFYNWPVRDAAPNSADYPPATNGDAFHLIGDPQLTYGGMVLIETTIDVVEPWGAGKHYWVAESCVSSG
jgi:hypothetical protein